MLYSIEFSVDGFPPAYDSGFSILNRAHNRYPLVTKLVNKATEIMKGRELLSGDIVIEVKCEASIEHLGTDTINLLAGIANVLQGIVYSNDNQIKEIHFKQLVSNTEKYSIRINRVAHL